jgi:hypothetical protein
MEKLLPGKIWVKGLRGIIAQGHRFKRHEEFFRMEAAISRRNRQSVADLLVGLDMLPPEKKPLPVQETPEVDFSLEPTEESGEETGLVIGVSPGALVLDPVDSVTVTRAIIAQRHMGKTYLGSLIAERMLAWQEEALPFCVVDPTGVWSALRSWADGSPSDYEMLVFGGEGSDVVIGPADGKRVVDAQETVYPLSTIVTLAHMSPSDQHQFAADYFSHLYERTSRKPLHVFVDESDEFAPQILRGGDNQKRSLEAVDRLVRRGRVKGIGSTLITQRLSVINKSVVSQADSMFFLGLKEKNDLEAVRGWIRHLSIEQQEKCLGELPVFSPGMAYYLNEGRLRRVVVDRKLTFDASKTPEVGTESKRPIPKLVDPAIVQKAQSIVSAKEQS